MKLKINENENVAMTFEEFKSRIQEIYHTKFPNSLCSVELVKMLGRSITIDCFLANDVSELSHGYWQNDMFKISFCIHDLPKNFEADSIMPDVMTLTNSNSHISITPPDRYLAYGSVKIPFRKTIGNANKIIFTFKKYVDKLYDIVNQQIAEDNIHSSFINIINDKII
jgi:vacuolar-type H+-ATPase subunit C/Vma6